MVKMRIKKEMLREGVKASTYGSVQLRGGRWSSHRKRNVSTGKMGPTITKELGEESPFPAHRGERAQLCSSGSLAAAAETTGTPQEVQRNWGSQRELPLKSKLHQSRFSVSISTPVPSSLPWAQPPPAPRDPAKAPLGRQLLRPFKPKREPEACSLRKTQTLWPAAAPTPTDSEKLRYFWI